MNDFLDFEGKSVEQAVDKACQELNISRETLNYDIISYGSTGIFGLVRTKKALIRVAPPEPDTAEPPDGTVAQSPGPETGAEVDDKDKAGNRSTINALLDEAFGETQGNDEASVSSHPPPLSNRLLLKPIRRFQLPRPCYVKF